MSCSRIYQILEKVIFNLEFEEELPFFANSEILKNIAYSDVFSADGSNSTLKHLCSSVMFPCLLAGLN